MKKWGHQVAKQDLTHQVLPKGLANSIMADFMQDHEGSSMIHSPNNVGRSHKIHPS